MGGCKLELVSIYMGTSFVLLINLVYEYIEMSLPLRGRPLICTFFSICVKTGVSKRSTVALLCYFLSWWCYFSYLVMNGAAHRATHGATATVTCATAKSSLDTPVKSK